MSTYLLINVCIIIVPFLFSFEKRMRFYKKIPGVLTAICTAGSAFILWDIIAASRGDWSFNDKHTLGIRLFSLPLEEILFFLTAPYSCLFIYECLAFFQKDKKLPLKLPLFMALAILLGILAVYNHGRYYTSTALLACVSFFLICVFFFKKLLTSRLYWTFVLITFIPFLIFNYILTSIPVITYNPQAIWGVRILTIPLEDFFFNFSMLSFYLIVYLWQTKGLDYLR